MSRKLIFVSGLLMCVSWELRDADDTEDAFVVQKLVNHLYNWTQRSPLESLATIVEQYAPSLSSDLFDSYDAFLGMLDNKEQRVLLEGLTPDEAYADVVFLEVRKVATRFDEALTKLLFETNIDLARLVKKYGIF